MSQPRFLWLLILVIIASVGQTQTTELCGTRFEADPHFDRDAYRAFIQEKGGQRLDEIWIPVVARIVRHDDGTGGMNPQHLDDILADVNVHFAESNMTFFYCMDVQYVDVNVFYDFDRTLYTDSLVTYNIDNVVNIYFINKVLNDATSICGYASFPWRETEYVVVKNSCALNGSTTAHELGHYLGLYHTHETVHGFELVDGSNCIFAGDELCDTPADPRLGSHNVDADCEYTGTERDLNNERYEPDPANTMSYSRKACRTTFSPGQFDRMAYYLDRDRSYLFCESAASRERTAQQHTLRVIPNPVAGSVRIEIEPANAWPTGEIVVVQVCDALGIRQIHREMEMSAIQTGGIDLSWLVPGAYFLQISSEAKFVTSRLIKQ